MRGMVRKLAFEEQGCRLVQCALQQVSLKEAAGLASELRGCVQQACKSKHANFVLQKMVEVLPSVHFGFIAEELQGAALCVARNSYGCRVLCRLAEQDMEMVVELMEELLPAADALCRHQYAHYVIEAILEHGSQEQKRRICAAVRKDCAVNAKHRHAGHIVEKALMHCSVDDVLGLAADLIPDSPEARRKLARDRCGRHVVMALLRALRGLEQGSALIESVQADFASAFVKTPAM